MKQEVAAGCITTTVDGGDVDEARRSRAEHEARTAAWEAAPRPGWFAAWQEHPAFEGWELSGPFELNPEGENLGRYLSKDGYNVFAPWPRYGWPSGSHCWYFVHSRAGALLYATGTTVEAAFNRALTVALLWDRRVSEAAQQAPSPPPSIPPGTLTGESG